jgi:hypothetical protein
MSDPTAEGRRSPRVLLRIAVCLTANGRTQDAETSVVNRQGALVLSPEDHALHAELILTNLENGRTAAASVVWNGGSGQRSLFRLGIEMLEDQPDFWGPDYEPLAAKSVAASSY